MDILKVTCAIIINEQQRVFVAQRSSSMKLSLKWEFPGGKLEAGESEELCLIREIREELQVDIALKERLPGKIHHYDTFSIELIPFIATITAGDIVLKEHAQYIWANKQELTMLDWAAADIPVLHHYLTNYHDDI